MELIIDKAFLESIYFIAEESDSEIEQDFCVFLQKRVRDFVLITDIAEEDLPIEMDANPIFKVLAGKAVRTEHRQDVLPAVEDKDFYAQGSVFKLFCISLASAQKAQQLKEKYGYAYLTPENVGKEWKLFYSEREDKKMIVVNDDNTNLAKYRFKNWQNPPQLFSHPLNSILIFDKYLLSDDRDALEIKGNKPIFDINVEKLLACLLKYYAKGLKVDILIISEKLLKHNQEEDLQKIYEILKNFLTKLLFSEASNKSERNQLFYQHFNLTIMQYKGIKPEKFTVEHDRFIITNHFYINSGAGFNFFNKKGEANHRTRVEFDFVFLPVHQAYTISALRNLKHYLSSNKVCFYPTLVSPLEHRFFKELI